MTLDGFRDVTETPISLDFSNSWIADIRLNAGDKDGRTITVAITDNGQPITSTTGITSVALAYNTAPGVEVGDRVPMTPVSGQATATYRATLPRRAIAKPGVIALGVEVTTADGAKVCSRNFKGVIERAVWDAESTQGQDSLTRLEQLIADGDAAITRVNNAITDANNAVAAANQVIADARITGGNTTTLDPNQPATSSLRGSGLQRILDLSIPRGAGVTSAGATTLDPNKPATASMLQAGSKGDYTLMVGVPRGSRIIGVGANTVNPSQEAGASMSTDGAGDMSLILDIPRGSRIAGVTARTLATGEDATVTATRDAAGDATLAFGLPRGEKGDKGDPGDAGQVATATVAGVVKPGDNLSVRADGTLDAAAAQYELPVASDTTLGGVKPDGKTITAAADGTITAVAQTGPVEYRELVGYENAAQGYAVRVSDRTWLCCFNSFAMQTDGTTRLPYFYAFLRQAGSSSLTALVANPFDTNGITLLSTDGEQMRFSYGGGGRWAGVRAVSGLDAATLILTEA